MNFAEKMKNIARAANECKAQSNVVEVWKEAQRDSLKFRFDKEVIPHFERLASSGDLRPCTLRCWGKCTSNIPNAIELTRQILKDIAKPYGIELEYMVLINGGEVKATFVIN